MVLRPGAPLAVDLNLTDACNLKCRHCMTTGRPGGATLPTALAFRLLEDLAELHVHGISLTGGEPTLHPDFAAIVRRAAELGFYLQVSTNAVDVDGKTVEALANAGASVNVSLDGPDADSHDTLRGSPGAFDRAGEGIRRLVGSGVRVRVETVVMTVNLAHLPRLAALAARLGAGGYVVNDLRLIGRAAQEPGLRVSDSDFSELLARIPKMAGEVGIPIQTVRWTGEHPGGSRGDCSAAVVKCGVHPDGSFAPCLLFPRETGATDLARAWASPFFEAVAGAVLAPGHGCETSDRPRCPDCGGGCRAAALAWTGRVDGPDPSCRRLTEINSMGGR